MQFAGPAEAALSVAVFLMGLAIGSFLNVVIYRLPRDGLSLARPRRSFCPSCRNQIPWHDNIPVLGWLLLKGRCRSCGSPISFRYPLVELVCAALALSILSVEGLGLRFVLYYYFAVALTAIAFIDMELMVIPDILVWPTYVLGFVCAALVPTPQTAGLYLWERFLADGWSPWLVSLGGAAAGFVLGYGALWAASRAYRLWRGRDGLGDGDPPLLGLIGCYLGWTGVFPILLISTLIALAAVFAMVFLGRGIPTPRTRRTDGVKGRVGVTPIPFGPFLALAAVIWMFYGQSVKTWYFSLLGL
ncbi:MAG: prepilin peptidase [Deltaproteobacteria bacterium]|jgi:leader peptidase (prepilin peptidase)/N-methyltransferase|nr:prepilin peptidase [Deltaproteobacteria bacterium]